MTPAQIDALMAYLQVVMSVLVKHGRIDDQRRILEAWGACYEALLGDG